MSPAWVPLGRVSAALALPLYFVVNLVHSQAGLPRAMTLWALYAVALLAGLALARAIVRPLAARSPRPRLARAMDVALHGATMAGLAGLGFRTFVVPGDPRTARIVALLVVLALTWRYATLPPDLRSFVARGTAALGAALLAIPLVALPWSAPAAWVAAHVVVAAPRPTLGAVVPRPPRRILVVSFDALRARSLDLGLGPGRTPAFAALAREATTFTRCHTAGDRTRASVPTLLSGVRPPAIVATMDNFSGFVRDGALPGLAGHLRPAGYRAAFATTLVSPRQIGMGGEFAEGNAELFPLPDNHFNTASALPWREWGAWAVARVTGPRAWQRVVPSNEGLATMRRTFDLARRQLTGAVGPTFVWAHVGAPHEPYYDVDPSQFGRDELPTKFRVAAAASFYPEPVMRVVEARYERYVQYVDAEFGRFVAGLRRDGAWEDTLVVVTGDHGEQFVTGRAEHGDGNVGEDVAHVPLIIRTPAQATPATVDAPVATEDVVPTILTQVYARPVLGLPGLPLLPAHARDAALASRTTYTWARYEHLVEGKATPGAVAAYRGPFKYVHDLTRGVEALHDLDHDPRERQDVRARYPDVVAALRAAVARDLGP